MGWGGGVKKGGVKLGVRMSVVYANRIHSFNLHSHFPFFHCMGFHVLACVQPPFALSFYIYIYIEREREREGESFLFARVPAMSRFYGVWAGFSQNIYIPNGAAGFLKSI